MPKAGRKFLTLNLLGTEGAEAKFWLSASNIGRGGGGSRGGGVTPPCSCGVLPCTAVLIHPWGWGERIVIVVDSGPVRALVLWREWHRTCRAPPADTQGHAAQHGHRHGHTLQSAGPALGPQRPAGRASIARRHTSVPAGGWSATAHQQLLHAGLDQSHPIHAMLQRRGQQRAPGNRLKGVGGGVYPPPPPQHSGPDSTAKAFPSPNTSPNRISNRQ